MTPRSHQSNGDKEIDQRSVHEWKARSAFRKQGDNLIVQQSIANQWALLILLIVGTGVLIFLTAEFPDIMVQHLPLTGELSIPVPLFGLFFLATLALIRHRCRNTRFILTPEYLDFITGLAGWKKKSVRLRYNHIREIEIEQTIVQQTLDLGDVVVTPLAVGVERALMIKGIPAPELLKELLLARGTAQESQGHQ